MMIVGDGDDDVDGDHGDADDDDGAVDDDDVGDADDDDDEDDADEADPAASWLKIATTCRNSKTKPDILVDDYCQIMIQEAFVMLRNYVTGFNCIVKQMSDVTIVNELFNCVLIMEFLLSA